MACIHLRMNISDGLKHSRLLLVNKSGNMRNENANILYNTSLILLIGTIYLAAQIDAIFSMGSTKVHGDTIQFSKNEALSHLRSILTIILCFSGGILLLKARKVGWVISLSVLLLLITIAAGI